MANTTNTTTTTMTFEDAVVQIGDTMMSIYDTDADGNKVILDEEASKVAQETINEVRESAIEAFSPLFKNFQQHFADQQNRIKALQAQLDGLQKKTTSTASASASVPSDTSEKLTVVACPTLEWLKKNHKGKGKNIKGYTVFCMIYQNVHGKFPGEGVWKKDMSDSDKKPWNDVAKAYSEFLQASDTVVPTAVGSIVPSVSTANSFAANMTPEMLQAMFLAMQGQMAPQAPVVLSDARSAYNLWTSDWKKLPENKEKIFPPKDTWKNLPAAEKAKYEAKFKALQAARAAQKA